MNRRFTTRRGEAVDSRDGESALTAGENGFHSASVGLYLLLIIDQT